MPSLKSADPVVVHLQARLEELRTVFADLAYDLERQGRCDAADVVMQIDTRVRQLAEEMTVIGVVGGAGPATASDRRSSVPAGRPLARIG